MGISVHSLVRRPGVKVGAGSERSRVCPPPASPQPPALAFPGSRAQSRASRPPGERARGLGGLSGLPSRATHSPRKKGRIGSRCGVGGGPGLLGLVSSPTQAFLPACGSLGSSASEPRAPKGQKRSILQAPGSPPSTPRSEEGAPREQPPARARPTVAKRGGGGEPRGKRRPRDLSPSAGTERFKDISKKKAWKLSLLWDS